MAADVFVYLDTVQFTKNGLQNRNQIKTPNGASWLTVPVKHHLGQRINEIELADADCTQKHWKTLQTNYSRTAGFGRWRDELEWLLKRPYQMLTDLAIASTEWMLGKLETKARRIKSSEMRNVSGESSKLIASICREFGADEYLTGTGALAYLNSGDFSAINCEIQVQQWSPFKYDQPHAKAGFVADLSTIDLLLSCPDSAATLIGEAGSWTPLAAK